MLQIGSRPPGGSRLVVQGAQCCSRPKAGAGAWSQRMRPHDAGPGSPRTETGPRNPIARFLRPARNRLFASILRTCCISISEAFQNYFSSQLGCSTFQKKLLRFYSWSGKLINANVPQNATKPLNARRPLNTTRPLDAVTKCLLALMLNCVYACSQCNLLNKF